MVHKMSTSTTKRALIYRMARWAWSEHLWLNQCEPRSMHNDCTRWYTEWIQQVHQNELNPPIQLSLYVNRLNVTYKTIITSHFCNRTSDMRITSTWIWSTTRRIEEMNKVSLYKMNTSIMLCECTQYGHECDNPSEIPLSTYKYSYT